MKGNWGTAGFLQRHRLVGRLVFRVPIIARYVTRRVWREAERDPIFVTRLNAGLADANAGRLVRWEDVP